MGGRGSSAERSHKDYLERGNFENLDEYDEEIINSQDIGPAEEKRVFEDADRRIATSDTAIKNENETSLKSSLNKLKELREEAILTDDQRMKVGSNIIKIENMLADAERRRENNRRRGE